MVVLVSFQTCGQGLLQVKPTVAVLDILRLSEEGDAMRSRYKPHNRLV